MRLVSGLACWTMTCVFLRCGNGIWMIAQDMMVKRVNDFSKKMSAMYHIINRDESEKYKVSFCHP
ncbi:MAG: hypothetical protein NPIRA06_17180 [Nitrospirales bacterium]|nr:MAG: hypothetical protein NPIRA06_17180 [Nitrospirales bacterium]